LQIDQTFRVEGESCGPVIGLPPDGGIILDGSNTGNLFHSFGRFDVSANDVVRAERWDVGRSPADRWSSDAST